MKLHEFETYQCAIGNEDFKQDQQLLGLDHTDRVMVLTRSGCSVLNCAMLGVDR
jgi:hypothetical protein